MTTIRDGTVRDAAAFLELCKRLDRETKFMMLEPDERTTTVEAQAEILRAYSESSSGKLLVADSGSELVGFLSARGGGCRRAAHKAYLVIGVLQSHAGQGLGTRLFEQVEAWARETGLHRLELTVMAHNERAIALYEKRGFCVEGTIRHSLRVDGRYIDELSMGLLLEEEQGDA